MKLLSSPLLVAVTAFAMAPFLTGCEGGVKRAAGIKQTNSSPVVTNAPVAANSDEAAPARHGDSDFERFLRHCARYRAIAPKQYPRGVLKSGEQRMQGVGTHGARASHERPTLLNAYRFPTAVPRGLQAPFVGERRSWADELA